MVEPPEAFRDLGAGQGRQMEGEQTRSDGRSRKAVRVAETSSRGCQGVGVDNIQVDNVPLRERSWGEGETEG